MTEPNRNLWPRRAASLLGLDSHRTSHREKWLSAAGAFIGILAIVYLSLWTAGPSSMPIIVASMGAAAVLVFAVPYGALPQPWPLLAGNTVSGLIGVGCAHWIAPVPFAAAASVGLSVLAMYYLRCLHPPGGASALFAVIGGKAVASTGIEYAFVPVFINALFLMLAALLYNGLFTDRRNAMLHQPPSAVPAAGYKSVLQKDVRDALQQIDSAIDVSEEELYAIVRLSLAQAQHRHDLNDLPSRSGNGAVADAG